MSIQRSSKEPQRIAKLLARAGIASRRDIERMIEERRIAINGVAIDKPATLLTSLHGVTVDGQPVQAPAPARLFRYHKPTGLLTAARDPKGRPTIYDRLPKGLPRVMPVGRLDMNTEGLLLLTTDGELKRQLELPSTGIPRTYRARVFGDVSQDQLEDLIHGVEIEGVRYGSIDANLERRTGRNGWVEMRLTEGKNREVRRVLEYLGLQVSRLIRTAYGPFHLDDLPVGMVDEVRQHDLVAFKKALEGSGGKAASEIATGGRRPSPRTGAAQDAPPRRGASRGNPRAADERPRAPGGRPGKPDAPRPGKKPGTARPERADASPSRTASARPGSPRTDLTRPDRPRSGPARSGPARSGPARSGPSRSGPTRPGPSRSGPAPRGKR